jgi:hypothetical protein
MAGLGKSSKTPTSSRIPTEVGVTDLTSFRVYWRKILRFACLPLNRRLLGRQALNDAFLLLRI